LLEDNYSATRLHALHGSEKEGYSVSYSALWAPAIDAMQKRRSDPITFKTLTV